MRKRARGPGGIRPGLSGSTPEVGTEPAVEVGEGSRREAASAWPGWARALATAVLLFHLAALIAGALGAPPSSELERAVADVFAPYFDLTDLGYSYRFYAEPPPTPVVRATIAYADGRRPEETVRLPGRDVPGPRMRHQRQLALANALNVEVQEARIRNQDVGKGRLARAYARHLCRTRPGARSVTLHLEQHLIPELDRVRQALEDPGAPRFDLFGDRMFTTPEWIGDFPCDF